MKKRIIGLFIAVALISLSWLTAQADDKDYYIQITDEAASSHQELEITEHVVSEGDAVSHKIFVENQTGTAHSVKLTSIDILKNSILLDKVKFEFVVGETIFPFEKDNLIKNKSLFTLDAKKAGELILKMAVVGKLDNKYQGTSFTMRYTFQVVNLNPATSKEVPTPSIETGGEKSTPEKSAENKPLPEASEEIEPLPETSGVAYGDRFIPESIEGKFVIISIIEIVLVLILLAIALYLVWRKRKKERKKKQNDSK